ncbi:hypothetical protein M8J75_008622 [Diaphorina citri]|nr:hypothetical protein M8J75_008622 [Diaphorina citri]
MVICAFYILLVKDEVIADTDSDHIEGSGLGVNLFSPSILEELATTDRGEKVMKILTPTTLPSGYVVNKTIKDRVGTVTNNYQNTKDKDVSETDLYLLGAIEKLVYRVDLMDKRLRRTEELLQYVMENGHHDREDPCPANFTRIVKNCYHMSDRQLNWKSSMSMCKSLGGNLVEFETKEESLEVITFLLADKHFRGNDFWTGGLNPGLLWIWANSAKPVQNKEPTHPEDNIPGSGRCLKLAYNGSKKIFIYNGADCSIRQKYICEHEENTTERALGRIHKSLTLKQSEL